MIYLHDSTWERLFSMSGAASPQCMFLSEGLRWLLPSWLAAGLKKPVSVGPLTRLEVRGEVLQATLVKP